MDGPKDAVDTDPGQKVESNAPLSLVRWCFLVLLEADLVLVGRSLDSLFEMAESRQQTSKCSGLGEERDLRDVSTVLAAAARTLSIDASPSQSSPR